MIRWMLITVKNIKTLLINGLKRKNYPIFKNALYINKLQEIFINFDENIKKVIIQIA